MKLHKIILSLIPALALASCTGFDDPADRLTEIPADQVKPVRNVLLIEFTGQNCVNCPTAHEQIEGYQEMFGSRFISVSFHGDGTQMGIISGPMALGTETGFEYNKYFGIESWPSAVVDWNSGNLGSNYGKWLSDLVSGMIKPTDLEISAKAAVADSLITVEARMRSDKAQDPSSCIQIWLSEDSIVKMQLMPNGRPDINYVHNNVFRASAFTEIKGEPVSIPANAEQEVSRSIKVDPAWVPANMHAIVFVYTESKGVTTVVKVPVTD